MPCWLQRPNMVCMCHQLRVVTDIKHSHTHTRVWLWVQFVMHTAIVICSHIHAQDRVYRRIPECLARLQAYLPAKVGVHVQRKQHFPHTPE